MGKTDLSSDAIKRKQDKDYMKTLCSTYPPVKTKYTEPPPPPCTPQPCENKCPDTAKLDAIDALKGLPLSNNDGTLPANVSLPITDNKKEEESNETGTASDIASNNTKEQPVQTTNPSETVNNPPTQDNTDGSQANTDGSQANTDGSPIEIDDIKVDLKEPNQNDKETKLPQHPGGKSHRTTKKRNKMHPTRKTIKTSK